MSICLKQTFSKANPSHRYGNFVWPAPGVMMSQPELLVLGYWLTSRGDVSARNVSPGILAVFNQLVTYIENVININRCCSLHP